MLVRAFTQDGTFFLYQPDVAVSAGGSQALTGDYQLMAQVKFSYSHLPAGTDSVQVSHTLATSHGSLDLGLNGSVFGIETDPTSLAIEEPVIPGAVGIVDTTIRLFSGGIHHVIEHGGAGADYELDTQGLLLRDRPQSPSYNRTNRQIFWEEATAGQASDLTIGSLDVFRPLPDEMIEQWHWEIAAPYAAGKLELPLIPGWTPVFDDDVIVSTQINAQVPGHYDAIRARVHDDIGPSVLLVSPTDRALTVEFQFQGGKGLLGASGPRARE
jgi:hypothetical protein